MSERSPSIESSENNNNSELLTEKKGNLVYIINLNRNTCRTSMIDEILNPGLIRMIEEEYVFLILDPSAESISKIRKEHNLHPILDYECSVKNPYSIDHIFKFDDCLFLSLIDIPVSENLLEPTSIKIILMKSVMFVIAGERLDCIQEVFQKDMGFKITEIDDMDMIAVNALDRRSLYILNNNVRVSRRSALQLAPDSSRLKKLEMVLYKILHSMFLRIEDIIEKMDKEVGNCIDYVQNLSVDENNEFIIKINKTQKELSLCKAFVTRKAMLLPQLANTKFLSKTFNEYLKSMSLNMSKLEKKVISSKRMLKNNEKVYNSYVDEAISQSSKKLNRLLQVFSAITAIFLPLNIIAGFMGMNVTVPFQVDKTENYWPFLTIIIFSIAYLIFIVIFFKMKSWL